LPALILGLEAAHAFMATTRLPGEPIEEEVDDTPLQDSGDIPFDCMARLRTAPCSSQRALRNDLQLKVRQFATKKQPGRFPVPKRLIAKFFCLH